MEKPIDSSIKLPPIGFDEHGGLVKQSCSHWWRTLDIRGPKHHALSGLPPAAVDLGRIDRGEVVFTSPAQA